MQTFIDLFRPNPDQLVGLAALVAVFAGLAALGALIGGRRRLPETDAVTGWTVVTFAMTIAAAFTPVDLRWVAVVVFAAMVGAAVYVTVRDRTPVDRSLLRIIVLAAPAVWLAACMAISQWDEFTQWIPNARYLFEHDGLPRAGMPESPSEFPAYPHGLAYITYFASRLAGHLVENGSAILNVLLLAVFAVMVGRLVRDGAALRDAGNRAIPGPAVRSPDDLGWTYCALGGLAVTALNPTFVPKIVFTGYADTGTAVLVGMLCVLLWMLLNALAGEDTPLPARRLAWSFGVAAAALISLKQVNLVLFLLIAIAGSVVALRDPSIRLAAFLRHVPALAILPLAMYALWRLHLSLNEVTGEFRITPYGDWLVDQVGAIAARMALIASKKGGYFAVMLVACAFAARALWRIRQPFDRLALLIGVLFVGYTAFLLFAYVVAFGKVEGPRAASYWRYNMHLGGAAVAFAAYGIALLWRRWLGPRGRADIAWIPICLMVAAPIAAAAKIRFDARPTKVYVRAVAEEFIPLLPPGARLAIFDLTANGAFAIIVRYVANRRVALVGQMTAASRPTVQTISDVLASARPDYVWLHVPTPAAEQAFGLRLPERSSYLLQRTATGWGVFRSWPYPGYRHPDDVPD